MRVLHTSDWHIGSTLYKEDRTRDIQAALDEVIALTEQHHAELVIVSGDLFDQPLPSLPAQSLVANTLRRLARAATVVVIAGNHDSPALWRVSGIYAEADDRLILVPVARPPERGGILDLEMPCGQRARIACVPFVHQNRFVDLFADGAAHATYTDGIARLNSALHRGLLDGYDPARDVLLYTGHTHLAGAIPSGSERPMHITEDWAADPDTIPAVSYAALGHIHKAQQVKGGTYAGSLIQLDFAEAGEQKRVVLVDCEPGRPAEVTSLPLSAGRRLVRMQGTLEEIAEQAASITDEIVKATVSSDEPVEGLRDRLQQLMPGATLVAPEEIVAGRRLTAIHHAVEGEEEAEPTLGELFNRYLETQGVKSSTAERVRQVYAELSHAREMETTPVVGGLARLMEAKLPPPPGAKGAPQPTERSDGSGAPAAVGVSGGHAEDPGLAQTVLPELPAFE